MPLPVVLGYALTALVVALVNAVLRLFMWWAVYKYADLDLWLGTFLAYAGWDASHLALPVWMTEATDMVKGADAWVPIAEMVFLFKLYWTGVLAWIPFRLVMRLRVGQS